MGTEHTMQNRWDNICCITDNTRNQHILIRGISVNVMGERKGLGNKQRHEWCVTQGQALGRAELHACSHQFLELTSKKVYKDY